MKKPPKGFTLIELLVVIAIISIVATCVSRVAHSAIRQAKAAKCMSNMKNLHTAVVAYVADNGHYPYATSWEYYHKKAQMGVLVEKYYERVGWVAWALPSGDARGDYKPWGENNESNTSHAGEFIYPGCADERMTHAISEGSLFKYVGRDMSTYVCPSHKKTTPKSKNEKAQDIYLSYSMNSFFRWDNSTTRIVSDSGPERWVGKWDATRGVDASRMVLFIELDEEGETPDASDDKRVGINGKNFERAHVDDKYDIRIPHFYPDDCCWDWTDDYRDWPNECHEIGRFNHSKGGRYCHVIYLDGHVGSVREGASNEETETIFDDLHNPKKDE